MPSESIRKNVLAQLERIAILLVVAHAPKAENTSEGAAATPFQQWIEGDGEENQVMRDALETYTQLFKEKLISMAKAKGYKNDDQIVSYVRGIMKEWNEVIIHGIAKGDFQSCEQFLNKYPEIESFFQEKNNLLELPAKRYKEFAEKLEKTNRALQEQIKSAAEQRQERREQFVQNQYHQAEQASSLDGEMTNSIAKEMREAALQRRERSQAFFAPQTTRENFQANLTAKLLLGELEEAASKTLSRKELETKHKANPETALLAAASVHSHRELPTDLVTATVTEASTSLLTNSNIIAMENLVEQRVQSGENWNLHDILNEDGDREVIISIGEDTKKKEVKVTDSKIKYQIDACAEGAEVVSALDEVCAVKISVAGRSLDNVEKIIEPYLNKGLVVDIPKQIMEQLPETMKKRQQENKLRHGDRLPAYLQADENNANLRLR